jgi:uncharacterized membrane protein
MWKWLVLLQIILIARVQGFSSPHSVDVKRFPPSLPFSTVRSPTWSWSPFLVSRAPTTRSPDSLSLGALLSTSSLVGASDTWGNLATLTGNAALAQVLGRKTNIGRLLGGPVTAMAMTFFIASIGILSPGGTAASKSLQLLSLQLATPLILLGADLRDCVARCGPLLGSFLVASLATIVACSVGWFVSGRLLTAALGVDGLSIAAALMAKNIGGGINYIAVCQALSASPQAVAAGLCIDNIFALIYFPATSAIGAGRPDLLEVPPTTDAAAFNTTYSSTTASSSTISVQHVSTVLFLSSFLLWAGERLGKSNIGALPCCTLLTVLFASWAPSQWMSPALQKTADTLGTSCLYLFFATAGAPGLAVADSVKASMIPLTLFLTCLYSIHGMILWACYKLWGKTNAAFVPQRLLVASSAAIGGPATSVALAQANEWKSLMVPSLIVGNIGYAIATFCALAYYAILR